MDQGLRYQQQQRAIKKVIKLYKASTRRAKAVIVYITELF